MNTILQVPIPQTLRSSATAVAKEYGFSSLQELTRVLLTKIAKKELSLAITDTKSDQFLSVRAQKRYAKMIKDVESGKVKTKSFRNVEDIMNYLNS